MGTEADETDRPKREPKHTSIIYFHGMGTPKRYEELSRVLDTLDRYAQDANAEDRVGIIGKQKVGLEPSRSGDDEPVTYLRFSRFTRRDRSQAPEVQGNYRLYESYWSPAAAGSDTPVSVFLWMIRRMWNPIRVIGMPWRAHQRLKKTYLNRMFFDRGKMPAHRYVSLFRSYHLFEGMAARRQHPDGRFGSFKIYIRNLYRRAGDQALKDLLSLSYHWRGVLWKSQGAVAFLSFNAICFLFGISAVLIYLMAFVISLSGFDADWIQLFISRAGSLPGWLSMVAALGSILFGIVIGKFLKLFLSDVVFWTTTLEKDVRYKKRRDILRATENTVSHVLRDPQCDRVVIVAHSLGTAIAYETLLNLGRRLSADRQSKSAGPSHWEGLGKISHLLTFGSPIDRINYFFQLTFSRYHRFNRVSDTLLGRTTDLPFQDHGETQIHWVNIRDRADPVASRLFSPRGDLPNRDHIHEVEVTSSHVPDPAGAHTRYFDNRLSAKLLFDACVLGRTSLQLQLPQERPSWSRFLAESFRMALLWLMTAFCWLLATGGIGYWFDHQPLIAFAQIGIATVVALSFAICVVGMIADRRHSLLLPT